jgi:hypothetical protein
MRQCDGAEAKHAGVPLRRVDVAVHLIAVGPDLNLAWHFRCRVALPVIRPTARADERDAFVKSDGTLTTADRRRHRCVLPAHASQVDRWRPRASAGRHQHHRTDRPRPGPLPQRMPTRRTRPECPTVARRYRHFPRSRSPLAAMMKRGETVCEVHRAGRSRQGLAVQGCPRVGRRPRLLVLSRRRSRNGRGLRAGGAPGVVRGDRDRR